MAVGQMLKTDGVGSECGGTISTVSALWSRYTRTPIKAQEAHGVFDLPGSDRSSDAVVVFVQAKEGPTGARLAHENDVSCVA